MFEINDGYWTSSKEYILSITSVKNKSSISYYVIYTFKKRFHIEYTKVISLIAGCNCARLHTQTMKRTFIRIKESNRNCKNYEGHSFSI